VSAGAGATLCIHEATFEACMESHALAKSHSTLQEALEVTDKMGAYR
jgi:ribonuclease Z